MTEEQGERFRLDIKKMETINLGRSGCCMMADYCWSLKRDCHLLEKPRRKARKRKFMPQRNGATFYIIVDAGQAGFNQ